MSVQDIVKCLSEALPASPKQIAEPHRRGLRQLDDTSLDRVEEILKSYSAQMSAYLTAQEQESMTILSAIARFTESIGAFDQRAVVKVQGMAKRLRQMELPREADDLERVIEEQLRDTRMATQRLNEDIRSSELRKQRALPGPGSQHASDALLTLETSVRGWDRYCLVRYEFQSRPGVQIDADAMMEAIPERVGYNVRTVVAEPGVLLAAVNCQLLEYAGQAESMERSMSQLSGAVCNSRVVEPMRGELMREAMARLEKAG